LAVLNHLYERGSWLRRLTLDNNCLIALEKGEEPTATALRVLIAAHDARQVTVRVVCVSGFERPQGEARIPFIEEFYARLRRIGLAGVEVLSSIVYLDMDTRLDSRFILGSDGDFAFEQWIHRTLFPDDGDGTWESYCIARRAWDEARRERVWKNHKRDVLTLWGHIYHAGDIFLTTDRNFFKATKKQALIGRGATAIMRPDEAVQYFQQQGVVA